MEEFNSCDNNFIPLLAESIGCGTLTRNEPRIFIGDRSEILDYCKKENLVPITYLVAGIEGSTKSNFIKVKIVPSRLEKVIGPPVINFITDKNIGFNDYVIVCPDVVTYQLNNY